MFIRQTSDPLQLDGGLPDPGTGYERLPAPEIEAAVVAQI